MLAHLISYLALFGSLEALTVADKLPPVNIPDQSPSSSFATLVTKRQVNTGEEATPIVCGQEGANPVAFGDEDHRAAVTQANTMDWIAFSVSGPADDPRISSIEIKYQNTPTITHGKVEGLRKQMLFNADNKAHITEVRVDCGTRSGANRNGLNYIQYLSIKSSSGQSIEGGKVNPQHSTVTKRVGKRVASVRGNLDDSGRVQNLGLIWVSSSFGKWPPSEVSE